MALTPEIRAVQARVLSVQRQSTQELKVLQARSLAVYNIPADTLRATSVNINVVHRDPSVIQATQAHVLAVVRGRTDTPLLRAWSFTLDAHDFYVLKLGTGGKTLVFDLTTKEWSWWSSAGSSSWRASVGVNWDSAGSIPQEFGSNVIVGDDTLGVLWVLDPSQGFDDSVVEVAPDTAAPPAPFPRVATAQIPVRGRNFEQVFNVFLAATTGEPALAGNTFQLEYSDDKGQTYVLAGQPQTVEEGDYDQEFYWTSLGCLRSPGRLFRLTDNGSFPKIDSLDINVGLEE